MNKDKGKSALLEIGVEELPARFIGPAMEQLKNNAQRELAAAGLAFTQLQAWGTPRRLALLITGLPPKAEDREDVAVGPPPKAAKDAEGRWTQAALGFAKAQKTSVEKLQIQTTAKGERLVAVHPAKGLPTDQVLKTLFPALIGQLSFPKNMTWDDSDIRFARPIRWIVALLQSKVIRFKYAGLGADKTTIGLLALGGRKIPVGSPESYRDLLRNRCILVDPEDRRQKILAQLDAIPKKIKTGLKAIFSEDHLEEVVFITEYPVAIRGEFPGKYLPLPKEILTTVLRKHQKFFPVENSDGELSHHFIGVRNGPSDFQEGVKDGYERVTNARLADALFFFEHDKNTPLETLTAKLAGVSFINKMGTLLDKTERVKVLTEIISRDLNIEAKGRQDIHRAAQLSKTDLLTHLVGEFPELQGVAGRIFGALAGEAIVGTAIEEHYWPLTAEGKLPGSLEGAVLAVADKMDTLAANFALGLIPSGSQDPFGLRRSSIGIFRILLERKWPITVDQLVRTACAQLPAPFSADIEAPKKLLAFFSQRIHAWLTNQNYRFDEIEAVMADPNQTMSAMLEKLKSLQSLRSRPEFDALSIAIKRAANIIKQAQEKSCLPASADGLIFDGAEAVESQLIQALGAAAPKVEKALADGDFQNAFLELAALKAPVDAFFDGVMVMVEDETTRSRRLTILLHIKKLFDSVADFSRLQPLQADPASSL